ncbi:MAG: hypothetical protein OEW77_02975, partial [Gemmatimonadota bacterium]|nr:hypothetical protein [Gemmatimonadota bacterium]
MTAAATPRDTSLLRALERRATWVAALVALVAALMTMTADPIGVFNDDGIYLLTAKALAMGQGYVYPQLPGLPPAIHYPPVWPLILAAVWKVAPAFPANIAWLKLINPLVLAGAAAAAVVFGRRALGLPWWVALGGVVAATLTVPVLLLTNLLLSEPLFLALLLPTLLITERLVKEGGMRLALGAALLVAFLVLVRTLGGVVLVAGVLLLARERRWRELALFAGVTVLLLLPWQLFVWRASAGFPDELRGSYGPYLEWVVDGYRSGGWPFLRQVVAKNVSQTWTMLGVFFGLLVPGPLRHVAAGLATLSFGAGLVAIARRQHAPVTALALAGYLVIVLVWPFWVDRFLWVMWPLVILIALAAAHAGVNAFRAAGRRGAAQLVLALTGVLALGHETYNARGLANGWERSASRDMTGPGVRIVWQVNADRRLDGKVIATELAPMVALYTGQQVVPVDILTTREHLVDKTIPEHMDELLRLDRRFRPAAYLVLSGGPFYTALLNTPLDSGRTLRDVSEP